MSKVQLETRVEDRFHTGTQGKYLVVVCPKCGHENTLLAIVDRKLHMKAELVCQAPACGMGLNASSEVAETIAAEVD